MKRNTDPTKERCLDGSPVLCQAALETPMGRMIAVADSHGIRVLNWEDRKGLPAYLEKVLGGYGNFAQGSNRILDRLSMELREYFAGKRSVLSISSTQQGTPFDRTVWKALSRIPWGTTTTYGQIAASIGRPDAARTVARANGRNHVSIIVPCHRVIGANGSLVGYGGGLWRKEGLIGMEASANLEK